jgi:hypothetical protein
MGRRILTRMNPGLEKINQDYRGRPLEGNSDTDYADSTDFQVAAGGVFGGKRLQRILWRGILLKDYRVNRFIINS